MSDSPRSIAARFRHWPLGQLILARQRELYREPEALFWVYGFPILMVVALGIAFRNQPVEHIAVAVQEGPLASQVAESLAKRPKFDARTCDAADCRLQLRTGKVEVVVVAAGDSQRRYEYLYDPGRPESVLARNAVDDALQRDAGRQDPAIAEDRELVEPGGRYIDFLVPGLVGMSLMGGGLWGVGFVAVEMRIRKLLKRFLATPMKKRDFLLGLMLSRLLFMIPEIAVVLAFARLAFGVKIYGSGLAVVGLILLGAAVFAGLGLLIACRAKTLEAISGLMNLVMLPMWVFSGIFFSSERFPAAMQPLVRILPLTMLINALRAVMLEGAPLGAHLAEIAGLAAWAVVAFVVALRWFRWT